MNCNNMKIYYNKFLEKKKLLLLEVIDVNHKIVEILIVL